VSLPAGWIAVPRAYKEVETGKRADRPGLACALADCNRSKAVLVIATMRAEGLSLRQIAERLNGEGHTTRWGKARNQVQVGRVLGKG
jgi:hypothetical protein